MLHINKDMNTEMWSGFWVTAHIKQDLGDTRCIGEINVSCIKYIYVTVKKGNQSE